MLSRNPACSRAVQRQIRTPCDSLWISDELLSSTFQRFCLVTPPVRRNGSSVPGPLECRRRLGKRRITGLSEAVRLPIQDFGALWGISGAADRNQWQWEAPSIPSSQATKESTLEIPPWLRGYEPLPENDLPKSPRIDQPVYAEPRGIVQEDLDHFFGQLQAATFADAQKLCRHFAQDFKQKSILGLTSEELMMASLQQFAKRVPDVTIGAELTMTRCIEFYQAVWEGIRSCKVLKVTDLNGTLLNRLLCLLSRFASSESAQSIATSIIQHASTNQLNQMRQGVMRLARTWISSWSDLVPPSTFHVLKDEEPDVTATVHRKRIPTALKESVLALARCLEKLPSALANDVIRKSTSDVKGLFMARSLYQKKLQRMVRYSWASMVANMKCSNEDLLVRVWRELESVPCGIAKFKNESDIYKISLYEGTTLILDHWVSQGQIKSVVDVKKAFHAAAMLSHDHSPARLLLAIDESRELCWIKTKFMFRLLRRIERPHLIYPIIHSLIGSGVKIPQSLIADEIKKHSATDARTALNIYRQYRRHQHDYRPLLLDDCPDSVVEMIKHPSIHPEEIWGVLGVPRFSPRHISISRKILPRARVDLVHKMAGAFAQTECYSRRVALRNLMRCVMYLHRHGEPMSVELTRALCCIGVTKELLENNRVGTRKLAWILDLIAKVEGEEIASTIDKAVYGWRQQDVINKERERYNSNPLRLGPID